MTECRCLTLLLCLGLTGTLDGCAPATAIAAVPGGVPIAVIAAMEGTSVAVFGRGMVDMGVSALTGRDCSIVRLDRRQTYCAAREQLPTVPPLCSRTLGGTVTCWMDPEKFPIQPRQVADTPGLTKDQVEQVASRWPKWLNVPRNYGHDTPPLEGGQSPPSPTSAAGVGRGEGVTAAKLD